jgi:hypothetical protein
MSKRVFFVLLWVIHPLFAQSYPRNAATCDQCHSVPTKFGSSRLTVQRIGSPVNGKFVPGGEDLENVRQSHIWSVTDASTNDLPTP